MEHQTISIIGAGLAGLTAAIALNNIGIKTQVFEARKEIDSEGAGLGLGVNAIKAFEVLGIDLDVIQKGRIIPTFTVYDQFGKIITKTDFTQVSIIGNFAIHRSKLHQILLSKLDSSTIHFGKKVKSFETTDFAVKLIFEDGSTYFSNYVIVADGLHSRMRQMLMPDSKIRYAGYSCWRAIVKNCSHGIDQSFETWGSSGRVGIVPLLNNDLYWFACINATESNLCLKSYQVSDLHNHFKTYHSPIPNIIEQTNNTDIIYHDICDIEPLNQFTFGRIVLIGDAAHASTPNMGQGACQAIEDAVIIAQCLSQDADYEQAFQTFEKLRLKRTTWITETSMKIGRIAQLENQHLIKLRNAVLRSMPESFGIHQLKKIEKVDFKM